MHKQDRLEASGIQLYQDYYYIVFDNISAIAKLHVSLDKHHPGNTLIPGRRPMKQFEDITWSEESRRFYVAIENVEVNDETVGTVNSFEREAKSHGFKSKIREYDEHFNHLETRTVDHVFVQDNKGLEGLAVMNRNNQEYVLGLCEAAGNSSDQDSRQTGTGTVLVLEKISNRWQVSGTIHLPPSVRFDDYASLDIHDNRLAVISQTSSTLWVGEFKEDSWEFIDEGNIYQFPRSKSGQLKYCNVEGVTWKDRNTIAVVSDKRKSSDAGRCKKKDQSIHIFKIPI